MTLLIREQFREKVYDRDGGKCVVCGNPGVDTHHIIDRSLWPDGGYYIDNGVTLCDTHHLDAEKTLISCDKLRELAGIENVILPDHFYLDEHYDKWGNIILPTGVRIKGEMWSEPGVQKMLSEAGVMDQFSDYLKYPRTYHFPWSENLQNDDRMHTNVGFFEGKHIVASTKMDGENCNMYRDKIHARSVDSGNHASRDWIKALHGRIAHEIPEGFRICGENLYARHSIHYKHLDSYFQVFSIWDNNNIALSWEDTVEWCELLGLSTVPVLYDGIWDKEGVHLSYEHYCDYSLDDVEGYVVRIAGPIAYKDFRHSVGKFVRRHHVQTDQFWMSQPVVPNEVINV